MSEWFPCEKNNCAYYQKYTLPLANDAITEMFGGYKIPGNLINCLVCQQMNRQDRFEKVVDV